VYHEQINRREAVLYRAKVCHEDPKGVTAVLKIFNARYGKDAPLTVTWGKKHDDLGMFLDYSKKGKVKILMIDYINNMLADLPDGMSGEAATQAVNCLFQVNNGAKKAR
jgi:hypothetical protein